MYNWIDVSVNLGVVIFLVRGKHQHICAVCQLLQSTASSLPALPQVCLYSRASAPMPRHARHILFTVHHFEVQTVFTTISVYLKCCDSHHFNFLPTIHSQCV